MSLDDLIVEACERDDPPWGEVAALDVIGDAEASRSNAIKMKGHGFPVIPVFHYGEPWEYLAGYREEFGERIGLGGIATGLGMTQKRKWLEQAFARVYPAKFHGFGVASKSLLLDFPFYSVDTASWHTVGRYGRSAAVPTLTQPKKSVLDGTEFDGSGYDFRYEIRHYLEVEAEVTDRWRHESIFEGVAV